MSDNVLVDTNYWIALFHPNDPYHSAAVEQAEWLEAARIVMPWPVVYETLRTKFVKRPDRLLRFDQFLKRPEVAFIDDASYRQDAYEQCVEYSVHRKRPISMVDMLCRLIIEDVNVKIDALLTTNPKDFRDVCDHRRVSLL